MNRSPMLLLLFPALLCALSIQTVPLVPTYPVTALNIPQVDSFTPYTYFASTGYCQPSTTKSWSCGENCNANPDFIPFASGGDGSLVQFCMTIQEKGFGSDAHYALGYVGFSPSLDSVIVGHQGTDFSHLHADLTDQTNIPRNLDPTLFPGVDPSVRVHSGFADAQARTADLILSAIHTVLSNHTAHQVTIVGHSLGAAIALLDSVFLPLHLSTNIAVNMIGYGLPRVGNQAFTDYVDSHCNVTRVNNKKDFMPTLPARVLGYHQPSGEVHIDETNTWNSCPGHDNPSPLCCMGDVMTSPPGCLSDHWGPYNEITIGC